MSSIVANRLSLAGLDRPARSISPLTPSPSREVRGIRLFRAISRKLAHRSADDTDSRSSSSDSSSSGQLAPAPDSRLPPSPHHLPSSSSSDTGSESHVARPRHHHSTSAESIRKVFQHLHINVRSHSCNNAAEAKRKGKKAAPKKILRSPVTYTYAKGMSGLTQRIPKNQTRTFSNSSCGCGMQYMGEWSR